MQHKKKSSSTASRSKNRNLTKDQSRLTQNKHKYILYISQFVMREGTLSHLHSTCKENYSIC